MWSTKAARHRHWPVILGAAVAFVVLNTLAVLFGASVTAGLVAILFGVAWHISPWSALWLVN